MDFIKKHYEKIVFGLVLLGLVGALVFLPFLIAGDQQELKEVREGIINGKITPLPELDMSRQDGVFQRLQSPYELDFSTTNKLFNPVEWKKDMSGNWIKITTGHEVDAVVTKITPLYLMLTLDSVMTNALGTPPRYVIYVERQAAVNPAFRRRVQRYVSVDDPKKDVFTLKQVLGDTNDPSQLIVTLADTGETATVSKDKPFQRVDGYMADLKYDPEKFSRTGQRVGADLKFAGDDYNIVAIGPNEVILSAASNQKKTTLRYAP
jgi:hypothetical protein